jgi:hypothetical protein
MLLTGNTFGAKLGLLRHDSRFKWSVEVRRRGKKLLREGERM